MAPNNKPPILPILYMLIIFILSSIPIEGDKLGGLILTPPTVQNLLHVPLFGLLSFLWMRAFKKRAMSHELRAMTYALIITILYAAFDEFHQYFIPGREASFSDFLLDTIGCLIGLIVYKKMSIAKRKGGNTVDIH